MRPLSGQLSTGARCRRELYLLALAYDCCRPLPALAQAQFKLH